MMTKHLVDQYTVYIEPGVIYNTSIVETGLPTAEFQAHYT